MDNKYYETYVSAVILLMIIVLLTAIFLSSPAEASRGDIAKPLTNFDISSSVRRSAVGNRVSALLWTPTRTAFERVNSPVEFVVEWPRLPTVAEVQIKLAQEKLTEYIAKRAQEVEEKRKALELRLDREAFWTAVGLAMLCLGAFITVIYGWPKRVFKSPSDSGEIIQ